MVSKIPNLLTYAVTGVVCVVRLCCQIFWWSRYCEELSVLCTLIMNSVCQVKNQEVSWVLGA